MFGSREVGFLGETEFIADIYVSRHLLNLMLLKRTERCLIHYLCAVFHRDVFFVENGVVINIEKYI